MAMKEPMTDRQLDEIVRHVKKGVRQFGAQFRPNYSLHDMAEAVTKLSDNVEELGNRPTREEYNAVSRALGAAKAREKRAAKRGGDEQGNGESDDE